MPTADVIKAQNLLNQEKAARKVDAASKPSVRLKPQTEADKPKGEAMSTEKTTVLADAVSTATAKANGTPANVKSSITTIVSAAKPQTVDTHVVSKVNQITKPETAGIRPVEDIAKANIAAISTYPDTELGHKLRTVHMVIDCLEEGHILSSKDAVLNHLLDILKGCSTILWPNLGKEYSLLSSYGDRVYTTKPYKAYTMVELRTLLSKIMDDLEVFKKFFSLIATNAVRPLYNNGYNYTAPVVKKVSETHQKLTPELIASITKELDLKFNFEDLYWILSNPRASLQPTMKAFQVKLQEKILQISAGSKLRRVYSVDGYGNLIFTMSSEPKTERSYVLPTNRVMFSSHIDSIHGKQWREDTHQDIYYKDGILAVNGDKVGQVLGADDGTGVLVMLELIRADVEGTYVFFLDEEVGRKGSTYAAQNYRDYYAEFDMIVSFDRKGTSDIITRQSGLETASQKFATSLAAQLTKYGCDGLKSSPNGSYTDSYSFKDIIPECTNISVGYYSQHSANETQDIKYLSKFVAAITQVDWTLIAVDRDPKVVPVEDTFYGDYNGYYGRGTYGGNYGNPKNVNKGNANKKTDDSDVNGIIKDAMNKVAKDPELTPLINPMWDEETLRVFYMGQGAGFKLGKTVGYGDGYVAGYSAGEEAGFDQAVAEISTEGVPNDDYDTGFNEGYDKGYEDGTTDESARLRNKGKGRGKKGRVQ